MNRRIAIIISIVLALALTVVIVVTARKDYSTVTKTAEVAVVKNYIPAGTVISERDVEVQEIVASAAQGMAAPEDIISKSSKVGLIKGQHIYKEALSNMLLPREGYVEILVDTDLSRSAFALPGEKVNIHILLPQLKDIVLDDEVLRTERISELAPVTLNDVLVLRALNADGENLGEEGDGLLSMSRGDIEAVGLEIPVEKANEIIYAAHNKAIYLSKVSSFVASESLEDSGESIEDELPEDEPEESEEIIENE